MSEKLRPVSSARRLFLAVLTAVLLLGTLVVSVVSTAPPAGAFGTSQPMPIPAVSAGGYMTCGVRTDGTAACWGENGVPSNDVLATHPGGMSSPPAGVQFLEVNAGYATACGVTTTNALACWGSGRFDKFQVPFGSFTHVAPGRDYVCALRSNGTITCWGGDTLDPSATFLANIPSGTFTQLSLGNRHACALRTDGTIACWGFSMVDGQANAPAGTFSWVDVSNFTSCALRLDGTPLCWGRNQGLQQNYPGGSFTQLSTGFAHVCGLRADKTATCWGSNAGSSSGQTLVPPGTYTHVTAGTFHSCAVPLSGPPARCWGNNAAGRVQPAMSSVPPQQGYVGVDYSFQFTMANPAAPPAAIAHLSPAPSYTVVSGGLPPGLGLSPAGLLSGTPTGDGTYQVSVAASNGLSPPDCSNPGGGDMSCTPGVSSSIATATRTFNIQIGAVAPAPGSVAGQVTASGTGAPIAGATVNVAYAGGSPAGQTTTDGSGNYSVAGLFPGNYSVTASAPERQPTSKPAAVASDQTTTVDIVLPPLVRPTVAGVWNNHFETVSDGVFVEWSETFEQRMQVPQNYTVHAQAGCSDPAIATAFAGNWLPERPKIRDLQMTDWANVVPGGSYFLRVAPDTEFGTVSKQRNALQCVGFVAEMRAVDKSAVAGQVTTAATGAPIAGATVTVTRTIGLPGSVAGQATTDGSGNYSVTGLAPGPYSVTAAAAGHVSKSANATTVEGGTATSNFALKSVPVAANDAYTHYGSDTALIVGPTGVLANDADADADPLTVSLVSGPSRGSVTLNPDGSFTYQPEEDYVGNVSFTYKANDGAADSNVATVTITMGAGCRGTAATLTGTSGANKLTGTAGADVIAGLGGNDTIKGVGDNDVVCAGSGNDSIKVGVGDDYADGGSGDDSIYGDVGNDTLVGGAGIDNVMGEDGNDTLSGGSGTPDKCQGGNGADVFATEHGCEKITSIP